MATTKREIVKQAMGEIGLSSYVFDMTPEEYDDCLKRLDRMMAGWNGFGISIGYATPNNPDDSDLDEDSGLPDTTIDCVAMNLGIRIGPMFGKQVSVDTKIAAKQTYNALLTQFSKVPSMQLPDNLPVGAGNKRLPNDLQYFQPKNRVTTGTGQQLDINDGQEFDVGGDVYGPV